VPDSTKAVLEAAVRDIDLADIPFVEPFSRTIAP